MDVLTVKEKLDPVRSGRQYLPVLLAFFATYVIWGSTFLAIRIAVGEVPPLFAAGSRFALAGAMLYAWSRFRGIPSPTPVQWRNLSVLGSLMFLATYGLLFWAEKTVPSGMASLLVATIPIWTLILEVFVFKKIKLRWPLAVAIVLGFTGVVVLLAGAAESRLPLLPCLAILGGELCWVFGSVLSTSIALPESKTIIAGAEMLTGGLLLFAFSALAGEMHPFPHISMRAGLAIFYLVTAGSLIGFTAYVWLLGRMPATVVSSHAFINPVVAVALGSWLGGEVTTTRTLIGAGIILASVVLIFQCKPATR